MVLVCSDSAYAEPPSAAILFDAQGEHLSVRDYVVAKDKQAYDILLEVHKEGPSGTIATRQQGKLDPNRTNAQQTAQIQIKIAPEDRISALLVIKAGQKEVSRLQRYWPPKPIETTTN